CDRRSCRAHAHPRKITGPFRRLPLKPWDLGLRHVGRCGATGPRLTYVLMHRVGGLRAHRNEGEGAIEEVLTVGGDRMVDGDTLHRAIGPTYRTGQRMLAQDTRDERPLDEVTRVGFQSGELAQNSLALPAQ